MNTIPDRDRGADTKIYNGLTLSLYDLFVLGISNQWIWRCPTSHMVAHYREHTGKTHLDIGPGTGYYLTHIAPEKLTLLDLNKASLAAASKRSRQQSKVRTLRQSFFDPIDDARFDSIAANFLLHCIPDPTKWQRLAELREHLTPGGTLFGSTIIMDNHASRTAERLCSFYNKKHVFGNLNDTVEDLENALSWAENSQIRRIGQVVLFNAQRSMD